MLDAKLAKFKELLSLVDEGLTKKDFESNFKVLIEFVKKLKEQMAKETEAMRIMLKSATAQIALDKDTEMVEIKKTAMDYYEQEINKMMLNHEAMMSEMDKRMEMMEKSMPDEALVAKTASDLTITGVLPMVVAKDDFPEEISKVGDLIAKTVSGLLEIKDIKDLESVLEEIRQIKSQRMGGGGGLQRGVADSLYAPIGSTGALTVLTATGAVDDSNLIFTFASEPKLVVVNGVTYRHGHGCSIATTTVTLDSPVGTGGDIYAI